MKLDWRRDIIYATIMGVEGCALYALLALLNRQVADGSLSISQFLLAYPLVFAFNLGLRQLHWRIVWLYAVNAFAWITFTLLMVKTQLYGDLSFAEPAWLLALPQATANLLYSFGPALLILVASAISWGLGWHLARTRPGFAVVLAEFQFALTTLLIVFFIASVLGAQVDDAVPLTLAFFICALLGLPVAHSREEAGWLPGLQAGHWPGVLLVSIGLILILGLAIGSLVTPDLLQLIIAAAGWVWDQVMKGIIFLMSLLPEPGPIEPIPGMNQTGAQPEEGGIPFSIPEPLLSGLRLGWNLLFFGLILLALWRVSSQVFGWLRRKLTTTAGAEVESMPGAFKADILGLLKRILFRLLRIRFTRRQGKAEPREIASIRQVYRQLLQWAAADGWRRPVFQTPYEFLPTLEKLLPACAADFRFITQRYVSARYGLSPPSAGELVRLKQSWHQINRYHLARPESET